MKKIINFPETVVQEMCNGFAMAHPEIELIPKYKVIKRKTLNPGKVSLISGGGSGHEPAHAGFVGKGMLDAAVCGDVFASPSQIQIYQAIKAVASSKGVLLIIKNYSGDVMNFKNAAHLAKEDGIHVDYVIVDDDIAVKDSLYTVGRRGVAGTVFVHKIAGAAAEQGKSLEEVKRIAQKVIQNVNSVGFALTSCTVPAKGTPTFELQEDKMEYGVGIHGEPGIERIDIKTSGELAKKMVDSLCDELKADGSRVAVMVNGFGGTPLMELYLLFNDVAKNLSERNVTMARTFVGNYMTSIDMAGASLSILKLDEETEALLNESCGIADFQSAEKVSEKYFDYFAEINAVNTDQSYTGVDTPTAYGKVGEKFSLENMIYMIDIMSDCIIRNEIPFCELDAHAGDGDFGMSVAKGFRQLKREWKNIVSDTSTIGAFLEECSLVIMEHCGGASGPIWGSAFRAAARKIGCKNEIDVTEFAEMLGAAVCGIQDVGARSFGRGAVVGDKTLLDSLIPCSEKWQELKTGNFANAFMKGAEAAVEGADCTKKIVARMGRAGTVGKRSIGYPDAGAYALGVIFTEIAEKLQFE